MTDEWALRTELVESCKRMNQLGINRGTSGNISVRFGEGLLISPTGVPYDRLRPDDVVAMRWDGSFDGHVLPSSEWRFHRDLLLARADLHSVVHTHSTHATAVAILGREIPAIHYSIAAAGGDTIRCAPYAIFGSQALAEEVLRAMEGRRACLLAHHGQIAAHGTMASALALAVTVEELSRLYLLCLPLGMPPILSREQMMDVADKYKTYGQQPQTADARSDGAPASR